MDATERAAFAELAQSISTALAKFADEMGGAPTPIGREPWAKRELRQSLIIHQILEEGGTVTPARWQEIAAEQGYTGRAVSGFFRSNGQGMLQMVSNRVKVTKNGRERLARNQPRVNEVLAGRGV